MITRSFLIELLLAAVLGVSHDISGIALALWLLHATSMSCVYSVIRHRIRPREAMANNPQTAAAFRWYRWCMSFGPGPGVATVLWTFMRFIPVVGDVYWIARICSKEKLSLAPVLFLRSFSNDAASRNLAEAVIPSVSSRCVMSAIVHQSQSAAKLNRMTHHAWIPTTVALTNSEWREWVVDRLRGSFAAVVDATALSDSTRWELEQAVQILGSHAVAVLVASGQRDDFRGAVVFEYDPGAVDLIKPALRAWLDEVVNWRFRQPAVSTALAG